MLFAENGQRKLSNAIAALGRSVGACRESLIDRMSSGDELATARAEIAAVIAHEIRQPLTAIVLQAEAAMGWLAKNPTDLAEAQASLKRIAACGHHMSEVIAGISSMFRPEAWNRVPIDISNVIRETVTLAHDELQGERVAVQSSCPGHLPLVLGDPVQLQQVIFNLVMNAVDAMRAVTNRPRLLTISSAEIDDTYVQVTVKDSGKGIDSRLIDRIFDPFFTTKSRGMGIGLALCRSIIEAHEGRLWVSSQIDKETAFHFLLPTALTQSAASPDLEQCQQGSGRPATGPGARH